MMNQQLLIITNIFDELSKIKNKWFGLPEGQIYLRSSLRSNLGGKTLDIANIEFNEQYRGQGIFTQYLKLFEEEASKRGYVAVMVEQIINERLYKFLKNKNYKDIYELLLLKMPELLQEQMRQEYQEQTPNVYKLL